MSNTINNINIMKLFNSRVVLFLLVLLYPVFTLFFYKGMFILVFIGVFFSMFIDLLINSGRIRFVTKPLIIYAFFALPIVSAIWSLYKYETLFSGLIVLLNIGIFYLMMRASSLSNGRFIMALVHAIPVVMAISFAIIFIKFGEVRASTKQTSDVLQSFSNEGPAMVLICLPYIYYSLELYGRKYVNLLSLLSAFFVIYMSQSRGAIFMSIIMVPLLIYFYPSSIFVRSKKFIKTMFVIIVIGLISFCIFDIEKIFKPVLTRFTNSQLMNLNGFISPNSSMPDYGRSLIYFEGIKAICEKPILGIGYGSLLPYMDQKLGVGLGSVSHNIIITSWGEMGLPGVFVLLWLVISLINGLSRKKIKKIYLKKDRFIASATACSLIIAFIHAQFRPFYSNPMIPIVLAQAYIYILNYKVFISGKFIYNRKDNLITN